jgi:hypothetical protein
MYHNKMHGFISTATLFGSILKIIFPFFILVDFSSFVYYAYQECKIMTVIYLENSIEN